MQLPLAAQGAAAASRPDTPLQAAPSAPARTSMVCMRAPLSISRNTFSPSSPLLASFSTYVCGAGAASTRVGALWRR